MAKKKRILIADDVYIGAFDKFPSGKFDIINMPGIATKDILEIDCDALIIRSTRKLDKEFINKFEGKVIASFTKGTDHIDTTECKRKSITVIYAKEGNSISAAEHTMALILAAAKNLLSSDKLVREGNFSELDFQRTELFGKSIGIIGFGSIGSKVANISKAFGMKIYAHDIDPKVREKQKKTSFKSLKYILKNCDIVSVHIPLEDNVNFLSKEKLSLLKEGAIFINTSRGEVIDENYLIRLLIENKIRFAGLDVFKNEPDINESFFKLDNVVLSNHIAGKTVESRKKIAEEVAGKLLKYFKKH